MPVSQPPFATGNVHSQMTGKRDCRSPIPASPPFATAGTLAARRQASLTGLGAVVAGVCGGPDSRPECVSTPSTTRETAISKHATTHPKDHHRLIAPFCHFPRSPLRGTPPLCTRGHGSPGRRIPGSDRGCQSRADVRRPTSHEQNRHDATLHGGWPGCHGCRRREIKNLIPTSPARFRLDGIGPTGLGPDIGCQRGVGTRDGSLLEGETGSAWLPGSIGRRWSLEMPCVA